MQFDNPEITVILSVIPTIYQDSTLISLVDEPGFRISTFARSKMPAKRKTRPRIVQSSSAKNSRRAGTEDSVRKRAKKRVEEIEDEPKFTNANLALFQRFLKLSKNMPGASVQSLAEAMAPPPKTGASVDVDLTLEPGSDSDSDDEARRHREMWKVDSKYSVYIHISILDVTFLL